jgi:signal transduction histidine kinase
VTQQIRWLGENVQPPHAVFLQACWPEVFRVVKKDKSKPAKTTESHKSRAPDVLQQGQFLETVLESLTHPFYVIDANDYTIKMANSAARLGRITGTATCFALTHRTDRPCGMETHPCPLEIVKKTKKPAKVEHIHYDKDGNARNVEVHGFPILDSKGDVAQMIEYCLDITDRKRAEEALQFEKDKLTNILDSMEDGVYIASNGYEIEYINPALTKEFGPTNGRKCYEYFCDRADECPWCKSQDVFKGVTVRWEWHCPANNKTYDLLCTPIHNPDGSISKLEIFRDITERKKMEEDLRRHREHLEELVEARTTELTKVNRQLLEEISRRRGLERELLSVVERERQRTGRELHDGIGQQLTGIAFMVEALGQKLSEKSLSEEASYAEKVNRRIHHAAKQTHALVKGLQPIDLERSGLAFALQELAADTEQLFNVSCTFVCEKPVCTPGVTAATNLYRIAQEAITNAIKHGKARTITIALAGNEEALTLQVDNDGLAFPAGQVAGKGMGLSIMRYRAEMIEGSLDIRKGADGGTSVTCVVSNKASA